MGGTREGIVDASVRGHGFADPPPLPRDSGSHVVADLVRSFPDARVVVLDKLDYCATVRNLREVWDAPNLEFVRGDVCEANLVNYVLKKEGCDTVMHFAAQTHVDNSFGNSFEFTRTNVLGTHVMLEAAKAAGGQVRRFIHVSTDEVYGESPRDDGSEPFDELASMSPTNPYAASKASAEFLVKAYCKSFHLPAIITRSNNAYGPHQYPEKLVPKFIKLMELGRPLPIHGDGSSRRSMMHVDDVVGAFRVVLERGEPGQIYNIGTNEELSVMEVARAILRHYGREADESSLLYFVEDRAFNDARYNIARSKLAELGWAGPRITFDEGLARTVAWYRSNPLHFVDIESALVPHPRIGTEQPLVLPERQQQQQQQTQ